MKYKTASGHKLPETKQYSASLHKLNTYGNVIPNLPFGVQSWCHGIAIYLPNAKYPTNKYSTNNGSVIRISNRLTGKFRIHYLPGSIQEILLYGYQYLVGFAIAYNVLGRMEKK